MDVGATIVVARKLADAAARETLLGEPVDTRTGDFRRYLARRIGARPEECVLVLFFTQDGLFIAEDFYAGARRTGTTMPLRGTIRRAFELDACGILVAHNHPSGDASPSDADITTTRQIRDVVEALDFRLEDHCIVARNAVSSMREMGLL